MLTKEMKKQYQKEKELKLTRKQCMDKMKGSFENFQADLATCVANGHLDVCKVAVGNVVLLSLSAFPETFALLFKDMAND